MVRRRRANLRAPERPVQGTYHLPNLAAFLTRGDFFFFLGGGELGVFDSVCEQRVDILQTSRHIRIEVNGVEAANTRRASFLFETGLRRRTYIPIMDVQLDLLAPSDTTTACPYKVRAPYAIDVTHLTDNRVSGVGKPL